MDKTKRIPERSELDRKYMWKIDDLYPSDDQWKEDLAKAREYIDMASGYKGRLGENSRTLLQFFHLMDEISVKLDLLVNYAQRKSDEDTRVAKYQEMFSQAMRFYVEMQSSTSFVTPEILQISKEKMEQFYTECPQLQLYRLEIERVLRKRAHILSDKEEEILAMAQEMAQSPGEINSLFNNADMTYADGVDSKGNKHPVTHGSYIPLMMSEDRALRKSAFESLYAEYQKYQNTSASILSAEMKQRLFFSKARKYNDTLEAALDQTEIPVDIYYNLIDTIHSNIDVMHRYVALRKKALKLDELHFYDLYTPIVGDVKMTFTYEQAKELAIKALAPLGDEYIQILKKGFNDGWIDVYENKGKRSGAYSAGANVHPFVLLNFDGTLDSVFTLVHEMGHAIHSYLSNKNQPVVYSEYVIFVAEVASTCNEALLLDYLLKTTDSNEERAYLLNHSLDQFKSTVYRQAMFAEYELELNKMMQNGEGLTAEALCEKYSGLQRLYFGKDIIIDAQIAHEWQRIPHFYYNYYVYQYATGYSAAIALSKKILTEGECAVKNYIRFLSGGSSADPITLLKGAGVDMSTPKPIEAAIAMFDEHLRELENIFN